MKRALAKLWSWCTRHKRWGVAAIFAAITFCQVVHVQIPDWLYTILAAFGFVAVDRKIDSRLPAGQKVSP